MTLGVPYGIVGSTGRMGHELEAAAGAAPCLRVWIDGEECSGAPRVIFDFSSASALRRTAELCRQYHCGLVLGTTALKEEHFALLRNLAEEVPVVQSSNYSVGIAVMAMMLRRYGPLLKDWDAELAEAHHIHKKDAPSGTALALEKALGRDVPIHSFRLGGLPGDHIAIFGSEGETLTISHRAINRSVFAMGAVRAARFVLTREKGLYTFEDALRGQSQLETVNAQ
ncbi:MAG: 4-hydroxy-tetrahydrodipicolinate reductase [Pyramidobacter sp.]|jgi:4-hydroxy-tetrahydrodipicolinate reductase